MMLGILPRTGGRKRSPYDHRLEDRVQQQLDLLGEAQIGFGKIDFPQFKLSVVGSRPFSWGRAKNGKNERFYRDRFGVNNFSESTARIIAAAEETTYDTVICIGHNGPIGLGDKPEDSCGKDWQPLGGDYGDPDFAEAIAQIRTSGKQIPLVTFGSYAPSSTAHFPNFAKQLIRERRGQFILMLPVYPRIVEVGRRTITQFFFCFFRRRRCCRGFPRLDRRRSRHQFSASSFPSSEI